MGVVQDAHGVESLCPSPVCRRHVPFLALNQRVIEPQHSGIAQIGKVVMKPAQEVFYRQILAQSSHNGCFIDPFQRHPVGLNPVLRKNHRRRLKIERFAHDCQYFIADGHAPRHVSAPHR